METLSYVTSQLPTLAPMLLIYLIGVVLSLIHLKELGQPAAFALVGCGLLFLINAVYPFVQGYLIVSRSESQWTMAQLGMWMNGLGIIRTLLHLTAFSLLLAAIFADRGTWAGPKSGKTGQEEPDLLM